MYESTGTKLTESLATFDAFDRPLSSTDGRALTTTINGYLPNGSVISQTDSAKKVT